MGILVLDPTEDSRVPFLRGILTRSLRVAGLSFAEAYTISNAVRNRLGSDAEISTDELTDLVASMLEEAGHEDVLYAYLTGPQIRPAMIVHDREGRNQAFSRAHLARSLERCGLPPEECDDISLAVEHQLASTDQDEINSQEIAQITYTYLCDREPKEIARRYLVWLEFFSSDKPQILLLGGTTGAGKSTFGAAVAHRLGIVRTQSTDMLREVMRVMPGSEHNEVLNASSFAAWKALDGKPEPTTPHKEVIAGFMMQATTVAVAIEGVMRRAEREQIALILEGVHVYPALQRRLEDTLDAIVVPAILSVPKKKRLKRQLQGRGQDVPTRRAKRYLEHFDAIWQLQTFLIDEAERLGVTVIPSVEDEETLGLFMETISECLAKHFTGKPADVFA